LTPFRNCFFAANSFIFIAFLGLALIVGSAVRAQNVAQLVNECRAALERQGRHNAAWIRTVCSCPMIDPEISINVAKTNPSVAPWVPRVVAACGGDVQVGDANVARKPVNSALPPEAQAAFDYLRQALRGRFVGSSVVFNAVNGDACHISVIYSGILNYNYLYNMADISLESISATEKDGQTLSHPLIFHTSANV
jgi:hypothetical protein